tara:strand:+ start:845 stop:1729 length:885 start_codon:yes stop_codon:yes gene_type:complete
MRKKIKHSKLKNTAIIFECLVRQITADIFEKKNGSKAANIIKKFFNENTELGKELALYNVLSNAKFKSDKKADFLITESIKDYKSIVKSKLKKEKYNLINEINRNYNIDKLLSSKIDEYKVYASIYKLFEYGESLKPNDKTEIYFNILENITTNNKLNNLKMKEMISSKKTSDVMNDSDLRILTYKTLLEKFNDKYSSLNSNQRQLLRAYINNISNLNSLKEYIQKRIPNLKENLKKHLKTVDNKIVKIKLNESINILSGLCKSNKSSVNDKTVITMLRYYELLKELKLHENKK